MADLPKRLAELSPDRRQLLSRLLAQKVELDPSAAAAVATNRAIDSGSLGPHKAECRRFYDEISRGLNDSAFAEFSLFLNLGYAGEPSESAVTLPEQYLNKNSVRLVLEVIGSCDLERKRILDVGCGRGGTVSVIKQFFRANRVCGVDLAPAAIQFCRANHCYTGVMFEIGDAESLVFPDASFDIVTNIESSSTYPDVRAFYQQVWRVLADGGHFLYTDALPAGRFAECTAYLRRLGFNSESDRDITPNVLASCDQIANYRKQAYGARAAGAMDDFLAAPGSNIYETMMRGEWTYRIQRWAKPGVLFGTG
jgi:SAM-dependent methyltransferase